MKNYYQIRLTSFFQQVWSLLKDAYFEWSKANAQVWGAALAFYTIFSLAPMFIIVAAIAGFFLGQVSVQNYLIDQMSHFIGLHNAESVMAIIKNSYQFGSGIIAGIIAVILILVGSTSALVTLKGALDTMWDIIASDWGLIDLIKERLSSLLVLLLIGIILFLSMILASIMPALKLILGNYVNIPYGFINAVNEFFMVVIIALLFAMLFKFLPDVKITWKDATIGGAITAVLFALGKYLLGLYLGKSTISSAYGAAGSLVVFLMWIYYSALILLFGAAFTQVYARRYGSPIVPKKPETTGT